MAQASPFCNNDSVAIDAYILRLNTELDVALSTL
jgi:hypothetical protein